ncbi:MAG: hypothetical protein EOM55_00315 [Clostridia bacterium]|nr:hypothetical protein [Clostridia bacterium]
MNCQKINNKGILSRFFILTFALVVSLCLAFVTFVKNEQNTNVFAEVWNGTDGKSSEVSATFSGGLGTVESPYLIATAVDLAQLASNVNVGTEDYEGYKSAYYKQTADITLNDEVFTFDADSGLIIMTDGINTAYIGTGVTGNAGGNTTFDSTASVRGTSYSDVTGTIGVYTGTVNSWIKIGTESNGFSGHFNGNGFQISGIYINNISADADYEGLFGNSSMGASLELIRVSNSCIIADTQVGGVVGMNLGSIDKCYNSSIVSGFSLVGGIAGTNMSLISNSINEGTIVGGAITDGISLGGIAGLNGLNIKNCQNNGTVLGNGSYLGGIIGNTNSGSILNSFNTGIVQGKTSSNFYVGSISGSSSGTVGYSYYLAGSATLKDGENTIIHNALGNSAQSTVTTDPVNVRSFTKTGYNILLSSEITIGSGENVYTVTDLTSALNAWINNESTPADYLVWEDSVSYPVFETATITYDGNDSTSGSVTGGDYLPGSIVTVQGVGSLLKTGYTFAGWNTSSNGTGISYEVNATLEMTSDVTLYAQWALISPTVGSETGVIIAYDGLSHDISVGATHTLSATFPLTYQWFKGGTEEINLIADATSATYSVKNVADSGSYYCKVSISDSTQTKTTTSAVVTATITKVAITHGADPVSVTYDGNAHYIVINASDFRGTDTLESVGTVTYSSTGIFDSYSSTPIGLTKVGVITVYYKATFDNYNDFSGSATLTINAKSLAVAWLGIDGTDNFLYVYDGTTHCPTASVATGVGEETLSLTVTGGQTNYSASAYTATASMTTANSNYSLTNTTKEFYIAKATYNMSSISLSNVTVEYDGNAHSLAISGTLPDGVTVSYANNSKTNVGEYEVSANFTGEDTTNYNTITSMTATLTITAKELTVVWLGEGGSAEDFSWVYSGSSVCPTASVTTGVGTETVTLSISGDQTDAGTHTATAVISPENTNYTLANSTKTFYITTILLNEPTVTGTYIFDGSTKTVGFSAGYFPSLMSMSGASTGTTAGTYEVVFTLTYPTNYMWGDGEDGKVTWTIEKATYNMSGISFSDSTVTYNNTAYPLAISGTLPSGVTVSYTNNAQIIAGSHTVTAVFTGNINYNDIEDMTATLTINPAVLEYDAEDIIALSKAYTGSVLTWAITDFTTVPANTTVSAVAVIADENYTNVGSPTINVTLQADSNHTFITTAGDTADFIVTLSITQATNSWTTDLSITGWTYGGTPNAPTAVATFGTVVFTYSSNGTDYSSTVPTTAGTYWVKATVTGTNDYTGIEDTETFIIAKAKLDEPTVTETYTYTGISQSVSYSDDSHMTVAGDTAGTNAGTYNLTFTLTDTTNYEWNAGSDGTVTWTIAPAVLTYTSDNIVAISKAYTGSDLTWATTDFTTVPANTTVSAVAVVTDPVQDYTTVGNPKINVTLTADSNHTFATNAGDTRTFEVRTAITKAENSITVALSNAGWNYGAETLSTPTITTAFGTATFTYSATEDGTYDLTLSSATIVGTYWVKATVEGTANYEGIVSPAVSFSVSPAPLTYNQSDLHPTGRAYTGIELIFSESGFTTPTYTTIIDIAKISGQNYISAGNPTINVTLLADSNHTFATTAGDTKTFAVSLSILKATNSWITALSITNWSYGSTANSPTAVAKFGSVLYTYSTAENGTYTGTIPSVTANTYWVKATVAGTNDYTSLESKVSFAIDKAKLDEPTVIGTYTYTGLSQTVAYEYDDTKLTLDTETTTSSATNAGTYSLYFTIDDTANYQWNEESDGTVTWTIAKATLESTTANISGEYDGTNRSITVSASGFVNSETFASGAAPTITYSSTGLEDSYNSTNIVATDVEDSCTVYFIATFANYEDLTGSATITITAKSLAVAWLGEESSTTDFSWVYSGTSVCPTASVTTGVGEETVALTISGAKTDAGSYSATAEMTTANSNYTLTNTTKEFTITKVTLTNTTSAVSTNYNGSAHYIAVSASGFVNSETIALGTITYSSTGDVGSYVSENIGVTNVADSKTIYFIATFDNYNTLTGSALVTITPASINGYVAANITGTTSKVYTGSILEWGTGDFTAPEFTTVTNVAVIAEQTYTNVGAYSVNVTLTADGNHTFTGTAGDTKVIEKPLSIMIATNSWTTVLSITGWTYGGTPNAPTAVAKFGETVSFSYSTAVDGTYDLTMSSTTDAGTYYVKATVAGTSNYLVLESTISFVISKAGLDEPVITGTYTYTGSTATVGYSGFHLSTMGIHTDSQGTGISAGEYTLHFTLLNDNYQWNNGEDGKVTWTIEKATYNMSGISFEDYEVTYNNTAHSLAISGTLPSGVTASYDNNAQTSVGTYTVTASFSGDATNYYTISSITATLTINPAVLEYSASSITGTLSKTYSGVALTWESGDFTAPANTTVNLVAPIEGQDYTNSGSPTITVTLKANANYTFNGTSGDTEDFVVTLTIAKATLTENTVDVSAEYNGNAHYITVSASGFVTVETVSETIALATITYCATEDGTYNSTPIGVTNVSQGTVAVYFRATFDNYDDFSGSATITITAKSLAVAWLGEESSTTDFSWVYSGSSVCPTASVTTGVGEETLSLTVTGGQTNYSAIAYTATASMTTANSNYTLTNTTKEFSIAKATLEDSTDDVTATYDGEIHYLTVSATGFVNSETMALGTITYSLTETGGYSTDAIGATNVNQSKTVYYRVSFANYEDLTGSATITINPAVLEYSVSSITGTLSKTYSGVAQTWVVGDFTAPTNTTVTNVTVIEGQDYTNAGSPTITVRLQAGADYTFNETAGETKDFVVTLTIAKANLIDDTSDIQVDYDNSECTITVSATGFVTVDTTAGMGLATITYSATGLAGSYVSENIGVTNVADSKTIYFIATFDNYNTLTGSALVTITPASINSYVAANITGTTSKVYTGSVLEWGTGDFAAPSYTSVTEVAVIAGQDYTIVGAPTITVTLTADSNHTFATNAGDAKDFVVTLSITIATNTWITPLTFANWTYGGTPSIPTAVSTFGTPTILYSANSSSGFSSTIPTEAGTYFVKATVDGTTNYESLSHMKNFYILKAKLDEPVALSTYVYTGSLIEVEYTGFDSEKMTMSGDEEAINAGSYALSFVLKDTANYEWNTGSNGSVSWLIAKATYDMAGVGFANTSVEYNGSVRSIAITGTLPSGVSVSYSGSATVVGSYVITATFTGDSANYNAIPNKSALLIITKASYNMTGIGFADNATIYDTFAHSLAISGTLPGGVSVSYENNGKINAGSYIVKANFSGDTLNYNLISSMTATLTIAKATYTLTDVEFTNSTVTYNGNVHSIAISGLLPSGVEVSYTGGGTNVGTYIVIASFSVPTANYNRIDDMTALLTINRATYNMSGVTFENETVVYDGEIHSLAINGALPTGVSNPVYSNNDKTRPGIYEVVVNFTLANASNYNPVSLTATLTINSAMVQAITELDEVSITNEDGFSPENEFVVTRTESEEFDNSLLANETIYQTYEAGLYVNEVEQTDYTGVYTIKISYQKASDVASLRVLVFEDGEIVAKEATYSNGILTFEVEELGEFAIVETQETSFAWLIIILCFTGVIFAGAVAFGFVTIYTKTMPKAKSKRKTQK